jgi:hypothetical protein
LRSRGLWVKGKREGEEVSEGVGLVEGRERRGLKRAVGSEDVRWEVRWKVGSGIGAKGKEAKR